VRYLFQLFRNEGMPRAYGFNDVEHHGNIKIFSGVCKFFAQFRRNIGKV
jgi:hypothetical protein